MSFSITGLQTARQIAFFECAKDEENASFGIPNTRSSAMRISPHIYPSLPTDFFEAEQNNQVKYF